MKIDIKHLTKIYNKKVVIDDISLKLDDITSLAIIGPSGGGKSTLLRMIAGLEYPEKGSITVNDKRIVYEENYLRNYRTNIGMVFQAYNLFPHLTAFENITLPLIKVHNMTKKEAENIANKYLKQFKLIEHSNKRPLQLSGGQQQRVAIARAVSLSSQFILLDEPTSALDPELTAEVLDMINELPSLKKELILVTHEIGFALHSCEHIVFISEGKIVEEGKTQKILKKPKTTELKAFLDKILLWQ